MPPKRDDKGRFLKGEGGRPLGAKNKNTVALSLHLAAENPRTPLQVMLEVMSYYRQLWLDATEQATRHHAAELTVMAAARAAPYVHPRMVVIEEDQPVSVSVVDRREIAQHQVIDVPVNGHGPNGHGPNGSNGSNGGSPSQGLN